MQKPWKGPSVLSPSPTIRISRRSPLFHAIQYPPTSSTTRLHASPVSKGDSNEDSDNGGSEQISNDGEQSESKASSLNPKRFSTSRIGGRRSSDDGKQPNGRISSSFDTGNDDLARGGGGDIFGRIPAKALILLTCLLLALQGLFGRDDSSYYYYSYSSSSTIYETRVYNEETGEFDTTRQQRNYEDRRVKSNKLSLPPGQEYNIWQSPVEDGLLRLDEQIDKYVDTVIRESTSF